MVPSLSSISSLSVSSPFLVVHSDVWGPNHVNSKDDFHYFITFIDDFSRYGHIFLIKEKSKTLDKFKIFKTEVEKQLGKVIKIVRSN